MMPVRNAALAAALGLLGGCSAMGPELDLPGSYSAPYIAPAHPEGRFFTEPVRLSPVAGRPGVSLYVDPAFRADVRRDHSMYIAPIEVWLDPASPYQGLRASDVTALTEGFRKALLDDPNRQLALVDQPRRDAIVVRIALTHVTLSAKQAGLLDFTPVGLAVNAAKAAAGVSRVSVSTLGLLAEGIDGATGKTLFAVEMTPRTSLSGRADSAGRLDQLPAALQAEAARLRNVLYGLPQ